MDPVREVTVQRDVPAVMRDGTTLMSNVYRPAGGPHPVLLTRLPYGKDILGDATYFDSVKAALGGYIVVVQDVRGRYASEGGEFVPFVREFEDGHDTVEWAAKLPGSDGSVGMWGLSYFGKTQWHAAVMRPPSLKSMVPGQTWGNHLNGVQMRGGAQELGLMRFWAESLLAPEILFRRYRDDAAGDRRKAARPRRDDRHHPGGRRLRRPAPDASFPTPTTSSRSSAAASNAALKTKPGNT